MAAIVASKKGRKAVSKVAKEIEPEDVAPVAVATRDERAAAATRRARRGGRRALLGGGRLGGGEGEQTTLGAG